MKMTAVQEKVFYKLCELSFNWYDVNVFTSKDIAGCTGISRYAALKALHGLRDAGLVQNDCMGRPAVETGYEYKELVCDAMPPLHGFSLTPKALETDIYKQADRDNLQSLAEWANGCFTEKGITYG